MAMPEGKLVKAYILPGLPHLVFGEKVGRWAGLRRAFQAAGKAIRDAKPDVVMIFSTQWISVLGHLFQALPNPKGVHVDENWHHLGEIPFDFRVDVDLAHKAVEAAGSKGLQARAVNYEGFPVDTGTLVVAHFLGGGQSIPLAGVSCNIYAGREDEFTLGRTTAEALRQTGRRAVVVACTGLSGHFFTQEIEPEKDRLSTDEDDQWNRKMLDRMAQGKNAEAVEAAGEFAGATGADMGFKAFYWLMGALGTTSVPGKVLAYGPIWGTGAAVVEYDLG
jgi:2-aminophenol/2-amino-5-chlorophenol 1,6-dioxygenase alpha subunit